MFFRRKKKKVVEKSGPVTPINWQPLHTPNNSNKDDEQDFLERNKDLARQLNAARS